MMRGDGDVVSGWKNKMRSAVANVTLAGVLAERYRKMAEPGSAKKWLWGFVLSALVGRLTGAIMPTNKESRPKKTRGSKTARKATKKQRRNKISKSGNPKL
jgi:hypothetical protein